MIIPAFVDSDTKLRTGTEVVDRSAQRCRDEAIRADEADRFEDMVCAGLAITILGLLV